MTFLDQITPVILTFNEEENIARTLARLDWAHDIVVVDSGSTDRTLDISRGDPRVRVFNRAFDSHARQWGFAVHETNVATDWILRLDADYQLTNELIAELRATTPATETSAFRVGFDYAIFGIPLRTSLYPGNTILLRTGCFEVYDKGHTEAWRIAGPIIDLTQKIIHDDRKPMGRFVPAQARYMARELETLGPISAGFKVWLRRHPPLMPLAVFVYTYFFKGLFLDGRAGLFYAMQRLVAESVLSLMVLEEKIIKERKSAQEDN